MQDCDAAVAIVRASRPEDSVLLMRRTEREGDPWSGHWSFPGGRREPGESNLLDTALRELDEECGVALHHSQLDAALAPAAARRRAGRFLKVAPYVFQIERQTPTILDLNEAVEARWIPIARLADPSEHRLLPIPALPPGMLFPGLEFEHMPLWGFTYRLITEWLGLLPADRATAGRRTACRILNFLAARGRRVLHGWNGARAALVEGDIPTDELAAELAQPNGEIPLVNVVELSAGSVKITGLALEEYVIRATETPRE
ncbi:MAG: CoA pyrophosphatase [Acidobacteria bacterium]|nr:CoA pyrophosphatase [Acidobacteriota bacterium]